MSVELLCFRVNPGPPVRSILFCRTAPRIPTTLSPVGSRRIAVIIIILTSKKSTFVYCNEYICTPRSRREKSGSSARPRAVTGPVQSDLYSTTGSRCRRVSAEGGESGVNPEDASSSVSYPRDGEQTDFHR